MLSPISANPRTIGRRSWGWIQRRSSRRWVRGELIKPARPCCSMKLCQKSISPGFRRNETLNSGIREQVSKASKASTRSSGTDSPRILAAAKSVREYYFGGLDEFRIQLQKGGRGLTFPEGNAEKVNYFMYPYAEVDGSPLDYCMPSTFRYAITFAEEGGT